MKLTLYQLISPSLTPKQKMVFCKYFLSKYTEACIKQESIKFIQSEIGDILKSDIEVCSLRTEIYKQEKPTSQSSDTKSSTLEILSTKFSVSQNRWIYNNQLLKQNILDIFALSFS